MPSSWKNKRPQFHLCKQPVMSYLLENCRKAQLRSTATLYRHENIDGGHFNCFIVMLICQESGFSAYQISKLNECCTVTSDHTYNHFTGLGLKILMTLLYSNNWPNIWWFESTQPCYNAVVGGKKQCLFKQPCYIQTKMYRLYRKMTIHGHFSI